MVMKLLNSALFLGGLWCFANPISAFELDVTKEALIMNAGKTTVSELVVGDSAFVSFYNLCTNNSELFIVSDAYNEEKNSYGYSLKVKRIIGNAFAVTLVPPESVTSAITGDFFLTLGVRPGCDKYIETSPDRSIIKIDTIDGYSTLSDLVSSFATKQ